MANNYKIYQIQPELYPRIVQIVDGILYDGDGNIIEIIGSGSGHQGFQGVNGVDGFQGVQGINGIDGLQGIQGLLGYQGNFGLQGNTGQSGDLYYTVSTTSFSVPITGATVSFIVNPDLAYSPNQTIIVTPNSNISNKFYANIISYDRNVGSILVQCTEADNPGQTYSNWSVNLSGAVGTIGFQGWQGLQGIQGFQGWQGLQGIQGFQGLQGIQGFQGFQGLQGIQGFQGFQGFQGLQGFQGIQGFQGLQGMQGAQGPQGLQGFQGFQGNQGFDGFQGNQGRQGFQGLQGPQGFQGLQGFQGNQGLQGWQGYGVQGNQGLQGLQGNQSLQGLQGLQGNQGSQGVSGITVSGNPNTLSKFVTTSTIGNSSIIDNGGSITVGSSFIAGTNVAGGYYQDATNAAYRGITSSGDVGYSFQTISGATTKMYIGLYGSYAGRVGIGTTTPGYTLDVAGTANATNFVGNWNGYTYASVATGSTMVLRDSNGDGFFRYINTSGGGAERNSSGLGYVAGFNTSDYYIRSYNSTAVQAFLGLGSMAYQSTGTYYTAATSDGRFQPLENQRLSTSNSPAFVSGYVLFGSDGTYGAGGSYNYTTIGFQGSLSNGSNRIFAGNVAADGLYIASRTGQAINFWVNGSSNALVLASNTNATFAGSVTASNLSGTNTGDQTWSTLSGKPTTVSYWTNDSGYITTSSSISGAARYVDLLAGRSDATPYPVLWGVSQGTNPVTGNPYTYAFSCAAITITSSNGTLSATTFSGNLSGTWSQWNSYAAGLTGAGASGTWGINVTGSAASISGYNNPTTSATPNTIVYRDSGGYIPNSYFYTSGGGAERNSSGLGYVAGFNTSDYYIRSYNSTAVQTFLGLGSMAYQSTGTYYTAATSDGRYVYRAGDDISGTFYFNSNKGSGTYLAAYNSYSLEATSTDSGAAAMSFHRRGYYAIQIGLDPDNYFRIGGWSDGNVNRMSLSAAGAVTFSSSVTAGASTWFYTSGAAGWYNTTYSGGLYMTDSSYIRTYNGVGFYSNNEVRGATVRSETNIYTDVNYGYGQVGLYNSTIIQGVFAMGAAYTLTAGGGAGNLYGIGWSHPNAGGQSANLATHGMLVMVNGVTQAALTSNLWLNGGTISGAGTIYSNGYQCVYNTGTWSINISGSAAYLGGYYYDTWLGKQGTSYYQANTWIQWASTPSTGLYWSGTGSDLSYSEIYAVSLSHGSINVLGLNAGYTGIVMGSTSVSSKVGMFDSSGNGGSYDPTSGWHTYWHVGNTCLGIGGSNTSSGYKARVNGNIYTDGIVNCQSTGYFAGDVIAYYSDERLKTKIGKIENALDKILSLNGFRYTNNEIAKSFGYLSDDVQIGLSAQEVQKVAPELTTLAAFDIQLNEETNTFESKSGENYLTVNYDKLVPILIEAMKEQQLQIDELNKQLKLLNKQ